jgi:hypothetical protein
VSGIPIGLLTMFRTVVRKIAAGTAFEFGFFRDFEALHTSIQY